MIMSLLGIDEREVERFRGPGPVVGCTVVKVSVVNNADSQVLPNPSVAPGETVEDSPDPLFDCVDVRFH